MFCRLRTFRRRLVPVAAVRLPTTVACHDRYQTRKSPVRRVRRGATTSAAPSASYAGGRAAPDPPTRGPARWEVVLRLHARHAMCTELVTDKSIREYERSGATGYSSRPTLDSPAGRTREARTRSEQFLAVIRTWLRDRPQPRRFLAATSRSRPAAGRPPCACCCYPAANRRRERWWIDEVAIAYTAIRYLSLDPSRGPIRGQGWP